MKEEVVILIVEDDDGHARLIEKNLRRASIKNEMLRFADGQQILDFLFRRGEGRQREDLTPYLLLLDIRIPKIDGVEVLRQIKQDEELRKIPVIMLTTMSNYYYAVLLGFGFLWDRRESIGAALCGLSALTQCIDWTWHQTEETYTWVSLATVIFVVAATGGMAWRRAPDVAPPTDAPVTGPTAVPPAQPDTVTTSTTSASRLTGRRMCFMGDLPLARS